MLPNTTPKPKTAQQMTEHRKNLAVSFYQNNQLVQDPRGQIVRRTSSQPLASFNVYMREAQTEANLGITAFRETYPYITPLPSLYGKRKNFGTATAFITTSTYTIPEGADGVDVHLWGGGGKGQQNGATSRAGSGAYVTGSITLGPGNLLNVILNAGEGGTVGYGGKGGGYTGIYRGANVQSNYLAIAGGGGGCTNQVGGSEHVGGGATWSGTAWQGGAGPLSRTTDTNPYGTWGGAWYIGGGGGSQTQGGSSVGGAGSALQGGSGSPNPNNAQPYQLFPGGGGGGYFGGGGGGDTYSFQTGGGGGSSYTGGLVNPSGEDGAPASATPGGVRTQYYIPGYGGSGQNGRAVIVPYTLVFDI